MTETAPLSRWHPAHLAATLFGIGLLPKAPGTWGSLAALPGAWALLAVGGAPALALGAALVSVLGIWAAGRYAAALGREDPGACIIDEVAGQWIALLPAGLDPVGFLVGFLAFRAFDIVKPWPVGWADRTLPGGFGIMADDLLAGCYAAAVVWGAGYVL